LRRILKKDYIFSGPTVNQTKLPGKSISDKRNQKKKGMGLLIFGINI
jgi:hypothetical protein